MNTVCVIPARYSSSRLPGKPLIDICGKPMIAHTYERAKKTNLFDKIYALIDDERVVKICEQYEIPYIMTSSTHNTHISRIHEFSEKNVFDYYVCICGDEPIADTSVIEKLIPEKTTLEEYVGITVREMNNAPEVNDSGNIKAVLNDKNECVFLSRSPIPYPHKSVNYKYLKLVGIECYNKKALNFFNETEKGNIEKIEDVTLQRFLENHIKMKAVKSNNYSLSVDTEKDLEIIRKILGDSNEQ